jgi:CHAP domain
MTAPDVRQAQRRLHTNPYGRFYWGKRDGVFERRTDEACARAKYWLGYPDRGSNRYQVGGYGEFLDALLSGAHLAPEFEERRTARIERTKELRTKALQLAQGEEAKGLKEDPMGSNNVFFSRWYMRHPAGWRKKNEGPAWCAMFVTYLYSKAGSKAFARMPDDRWCNCMKVVEAAERGDGLLLTTNPQPGTVVVYDFPATRTSEGGTHIGLFEGWTNRRQGTFTAIEGNTALGDDNNGGEVARRDRNTAPVIAFVHVLR